MAIIYRCDRCDNETTDLNDINKLDFEYKSFTYSSGVDRLKKDLCQNCSRQLVDFCKPQAKPMKESF